MGVEESVLRAGEGDGKWANEKYHCRNQTKKKKIYENRNAPTKKVLRKEKESCTHSL